jgi:lipopolysaccharide/colanic/teichoic acid biosynthesis glycosyltransferase
VVKRTIDILLSLVFGLLSLPFCIIIAIAIKIDDGNSIFYLSPRIGLGGKKFNMLKFRTMSNDNYSLSNEQAVEFQHNFKLKHDNRITKVGYRLRRYSFDEIPQFLNVLKGDMSFIGPRPKLPEEIDLYENNKNELLSTLPGITGYWQVYRKNANSDENMRSMDLYYIRNRNIAMDFKIIFLTFLTLISKKNY